MKLAPLMGERGHKIILHERGDPRCAVSRSCVTVAILGEMEDDKAMVGLRMPFTALDATESGRPSVRPAPATCTAFLSNKGPLAARPRGPGDAGPWPET